MSLITLGRVSASIVSITIQVSYSDAADLEGHQPSRASDGTTEERFLIRTTYSYAPVHSPSNEMAWYLSVGNMMRLRAHVIDDLWAQTTIITRTHDSHFTQKRL